MDDLGFAPRQRFNESLRAAIVARAMEMEKFARSVGVNPKTVERWLGGRVPYPRLRWKICEILGKAERELWPDAEYPYEPYVPPPEALRDAGRIPAESVPVAAGKVVPAGEPGFGYPDEDDEDIMKRRAFLLGTAILAGIGAADPVTGLETARQGLNDALISRDDTDVSEWNEIAWDYGETYPVTAPAELIGTLSVDFAGLRAAFRRYPQDAAQRELYRVSALLAGFLAQTLSNLGHANEARRRWRTARYAADRSGDGYSALWVRGREIVHAIGERPATAVLSLVEQAERLIDQAPREAVLDLLGGKAQALAIADRPAEAENVLAQLRERFNAESGYSGSLLSWGEE